jgi:peptide/nickel transport system substrate-binding protein
VRLCAAAFALTLVVLAGCTKTSNGVTGARHSWTQPGRLRIAIATDLKDLNPLLSSNTADVFVDRLMFEPLVTADPKGNPLPMLAAAVPTLANGGISRDGLTVTYHLRRGFTWTDGVAVTAQDVKWSYEAIMNPNSDVISRHGYDVIAALTTPDPYTVVVRLKHPFAPFVDTFFAESDQPYMIVPAHVLSRYPTINQAPFNDKPTVSDGPFKFVSWSHGDRIVLARNDRFLLGRPHLERIDVRTVPDEDTAINLLATHSIDFIFEASIENYPALRALPDARIVWVNVNGYSYIQFNLARPFLSDPRVRLALAYAIDKNELVKTLAFGTQTTATADIPDWMWAFNPRVRSYPHDPAEARMLLREAGWRPGPDGILHKDGAALSLVLVTNNSSTTRRREALEVQAMLRQIGVDTEVKSYPADVLYAPAGMGGIFQLGRFDLTLSGWYAGIDPDDSTQFTCDNFPPGGYNYSRYCNPKMEAAQKIALTNYDRSARMGAYYEIQDLLVRDNPAIFVYWLRQMEPISVDFRGFDPNPVVESWNAWQWSI